MRVADRGHWFYGLIAFLLLAFMVGGNLYFVKVSVLLRVFLSLIAGGFAIVLAFRTTWGNTLWSQWLLVVQEVRRIHWPSRQETWQTTLAVLAMVVVMGVVLCTADFILLRAVKWLTQWWGV